jgi:NAD(P)-dependent dehydrogenase (short-subunit alcohol dehydrogenase family)
MKLAGKKALITGGNSGIGLATARLFISEGAEVAITGRDQQTLDEAVAELGSKARGYRADVTVLEDRKKLFAELSKDFGKLDIVFANAGISGRTPTGATDEAVFENVVRTNLNGFRIEAELVDHRCVRNPGSQYSDVDTFCLSG